MGLIDDLLDVQIPKGVKISPSGGQIIYTTSTYARSKQNTTLSTIWLAQTEHEKSACQLTSGKFNDIDPEWSPDGKFIAFVSDRERLGEASAIYTLPMNIGGDPLPLTSPDCRRPIEKFRWSPDGKSIAYISADEQTSEQKQREKEKNDANVWGENIALSCLRLVHVKTGDVTTLTLGLEHVVGLAWSPDGTHIAFTHSLTPQLDSKCLNGISISTIHVSTKNVRFIKHFDSIIGDPVWVGNSLFFASGLDPKFMSSSQALWSIDIESQTPEFRQRAHGIDDCLGVFVQSDHDIVIHAKHGVDSTIHALDGKSLLTYPGEISSFDIKQYGENGEFVLAVVKSSISEPAEVYSTATVNGPLTQLSSHGDILKGYEFGTPTVLKCPSADNEVSLDALYFAPANPKNRTRPFPTAVISHGGPYARSTDSFELQSTGWAPVLLEAGYGVLMPNYRGSSGRGNTFAAYARGRLGTIDYDDVITITQHAISEGYADPARLLIAGWSNGGSMSYLASVRNGQHNHGWHFRAAIAGAGAADPDTMHLTSDLGFAFDLDEPGSAPWSSEMHALEPRSRSSAVWAFKSAMSPGSGVTVPPLLILHCEQDRRVPIEQAVGMRRALQFYRLPFEFVSYPREGHRMVERNHVKDRMERCLRWAETYISP